MAFSTQYMGLRAWDLGTDNYAHPELTANWDKIDAHDHTPGRGLQLTGDSIQDNSVPGGKLTDGTISAAKLDPALFTLLSPIGAVLPWFRPQASIAPPAGWVVPIGQTLTSGQHAFPGISGSVLLPDLRNRFILGAATSGTGSGSGQPPAINDTGGSNTSGLAHSHTVNSHGHSIANDSPGTNGVGNHRHYGVWPIAKAQDLSEVYYVLKPGDPIESGDVATLTEGAFVAYDVRKNTGESASTVVSPGSFTLSAGSLVQTFRSGTSFDGAHSHTVNAHSHFGGTGNATPGTDTQLGSTDIRPNFIGLLYLMKVKNL